MYELNKELIAKLNNLLNKLETISRENPLYISIYNKFSELFYEINSLKTPLVYTREFLEKYIDLYLRIEDAGRILEKSSLYIAEELSLQLNELINSLDKYIIVLKKIYRREKILFGLPIYSVLVIYIGNILLYISTNQVLAISLTILPILVITSLYLNNRGFLTTSYIILSSSAILGVSLTIIHTRDQPYDYYNILLYLLIILTSFSYIHTSRFIKSKTSREKIVDFMNNLLKTTSKREYLRNDVLKTRELEEKAIELYRNLYGSDGDKLFNYKLNILLMHGYRREEALRKTISQTIRETN